MSRNDWAKKPLSDILELNESGVWGDEGGSTGYPVLRSSNIHEGRLVLLDVAYRRVRDDLVDRYELIDGDILVTKSSGSPQLIGKSCLFSNPDGRRYLFSNFTQRLRTKKQILDPAFLFLYLQSPSAKSYLQRISNTTSGLRNLNMKDYAKQPVPLPPLLVQKRIVAILEKANTAREKRRLANQLTEQFLQSAFLEMFGDPVANPKGWGIIDFPSIIESGPQNGLYRPSRDYGQGTPILRIDSFHDGEVHDISNLKRVRIDTETRNLYQLKENDIVINRVNSIKFLGKSAIVPKLSEPTVFESNMMRITLKRGFANPSFVIHMLQQGIVRNQILRRAKDAVNQSSINQEDVKSFKFPLPPLSEQQEFVFLVERVNSLRAKQKESEKELENLFNGLMQRAFRGDLVQ